MYITLETDYAVRIVNALAKNGVRMDAKTLSAATGVTLRFSLKILRKLVACEVVRSYKGSQGGYELARPADKISLGEVVEIVEGPISISRCVGAEGFCCSRVKDDADGGDAPCRFSEAYAEAAKLVRERLYAVTFKQ